jgi:hypothetical protein
MAKLRKMLLEDGRRLSHIDAAALIHVSERNAKEYLRLLRSELHIAEWVRRGTRGQWVAVYAALPGDDVPAPVRIKCAARKMKARQDPDVREKHNRSKRIVRAAERFFAGRLPVDPIMAALNRDAILRRP